MVETRIVLFLLVSIVAGAGCGGRTPDATADGGVGDGGVTTSDDAGFSITVTLSTVVPTVATVGWSLAGAPTIDQAHVEFGRPNTDEAMIAPVDVSGAAPYSVFLLGMKPSTEYQLRVVAGAGGATWTSNPVSVTTGAVLGSLPRVSVATSDAAHHAAGFIVTSLFAAPPGAVILDTDGAYVWWYLYSGSDSFQVSRARLSADHQWIYFWSVNLQGANPGGNGPGGGGGGTTSQKIVKVRVDGTGEQEISLPDGHHDFLVLDDGTIAYIEYDDRTVNGTSVAGDRLMELSPDGTTREVYSVWNDFQYAGEQVQQGEGWCHANALRYLPDEGIYYMGSKSFSSILEIDRASGTLLHVLGGSHSDFTVSTGGTQPYVGQHGFALDGDELLVFDNGSQTEKSTKAVEFRLDESGLIMTPTWSYTPSPTLFDFSMGDVAFLPNGNRLVTFSTSGQIDEVDGDGQLVWRASLSLGGALGYSVFKESLYE